MSVRPSRHKLQSKRVRNTRGKTRPADSIADISHQLRTPLTSVNLIASALLNPELNDEQRRGQIRDMQRRLDRIDWLISALLKIARLDADHITASRPNAV